MHSNVLINTIPYPLKVIPSKKIFSGLPSAVLPDVILPFYYEIQVLCVVTKYYLVIQNFPYAARHTWLEIL